MQIYLEFDPTSTKSELRINVVIKPSSAVGAFYGEYEYDSNYLQLKSISAGGEGEIYSHDKGGLAGVIYMNKAPSEETVLTLKFKVLQEGNSSVSAYYYDVLSSENTRLDFTNNNDCAITADASGVVASYSSPSKTSASSSSSGKITVSKEDSSYTVPSADTDDAPGENSFLHDFFTFQSNNPGFWAMCGALGTAAVVLIIFTSYKMGVRKSSNKNSGKDGKEE